MKNKRIKTAMFQAGINQMQLADLLNLSGTAVSIVLNTYELAVKEQNDIVARIREHDALRKRD